ncbi:MAG: hypothetical protein LBG12_02955 [Synergistaceae bacterium]|nr:hypothetical protein [Synergistaceae bacterium]
MTTQQMTERETLYRKIIELPDEDVKMVAQYVKGFEGHEPNEETIKVLEDVEAGRNMIGPYSNLEAMFKDFGIDVDPRAEHCVQK